MISVFLPQYNRSLKLKEDESLLELFQREGFYVPSDCAGAGTCGKCKIILKDIDYPIQPAEKKFLTDEEIDKGIRLACRIYPQQDCHVEFITLEKFEEDQILTEGKRRQIDIDPPLKKRFIEVKKPELASHHFDWESIQEALDHGMFDRTVPTNLLRKLPDILRQDDYKISIVYNDTHYIAAEVGDRSDQVYGLAIDLGTTTLVAKLIDLRSGAIRNTVSSLNPQQRIGADVISRIDYGNKRQDAFKRLQKMVIKTLNEMISHLAASTGISPDQIYDVSLVGNTVMEHLFLGLNSKYLALSPYTPVVKYYPDVLASEIGLAVHHFANVHLLPNIGRFVGGDTTGVILATGIDQTDKLTLAIDIGTNGEIVLGNRDKLLATSTAAGPAFEGARLRFGMRAAEGAIDRVEVHDGELHVHTIANTVPQGICGSGIITLIGELLRTDLISDRGHLQTDKDLNKEVLGLQERFRRIGKEKVFMLYQNDEQKVYLTQRDVGEIQLAKSAIRSGINILLSEYNVSIEEVDRILMAGAFGNFLDREQAIRIGLIPRIDSDNIHFIGNAACAGAELALLSGNYRNRAIDIAMDTRYVEIATRPDFQDQFAVNMLFPK